MLLTTRFDDAFGFAHELHRGHLRKGTSIAYVAHLMGVAALVIEHGGDENQAIGALLHDGPEDCGGEPVLGGIERRYGEDVARIVADCTDSWTDPKPQWRPRKQAYLDNLPQKGCRSLLVSLADTTKNAEAILYDWREIGEDVWRRFKGGPDGTRWYYRELACFFSRETPGRLSDRLTRATSEFAPSA